MRLTTLIFVLLSLSTLRGQTDYGGYYGITCGTRDTVQVFQSAPAPFLQGNAEVKTQFIIDFTDDVPAVAQVAIRFAANVWGSYLQSPVPIRVNVAWQDRDDSRLLASAGPSTLFRGFQGAESNTWYPVALAEAIAGQDLNEEEDPDINVNANSTANWYFGTDGETPRGEIDLVSVMLHELGHGLGFLSSVDTISEDQLSIGFGDRFIIYDLFMETEQGTPLTDASVFGNPSAELLEAATMNELVFDGPAAVRENNGEVVPLFAPGTFDVGSSVSHLNERTYPAGSENALMTPFLASGEAVHDPGPVTLGIFFDMGWPLRFNLTSTREAPAESLSVFPNPAASFFRFSLPGQARSGQAILFDLNGREVRRQRLPAGGGTIDFSVADLSPALYTLLVSDGERSWRQRVVVR